MGWTKPPSKGLSRINKIKEKIIYIYSLYVNYNNRLPAVGNDSLNGINCRRRAAIKYELTNIILKNNIIAWLNFYWTIPWSFSFGNARENQWKKKMHLPCCPFWWLCRSGGTAPSASPSTAGLGLPKMPLDAAIGPPVFAPYCPNGCHSHQFCRKKLSCAVVKLVFEASVQKARSGPSTQLIEATSCIERSNTMIKAKEHS